MTDTGIVESLCYVVDCVLKNIMLPENSRAVFVAFVFIYLPHDYNNYKKMPKKNVGRNGEEA